MDRTYCGARGLCLDADVTSENYHGSSCEDDELCRDSICVCQNRLDIRCVTDNVSIQTKTRLIVVHVGRVRMQMSTAPIIAVKAVAMVSDAKTACVLA